MDTKYSLIKKESQIPGVCHEKQNVKTNGTFWICIYDVAVVKQHSEREVNVKLIMSQK